MPGIYPSTLTNVHLKNFFKKTGFYKGKSDCKAVFFAAWGQGQSSGELSQAKFQIFLSF